MEYYDITLKIGQLAPENEPEWPMYSFDGPSAIVWNGIAQNLHRRGWSDDRIKTWLQSKDARWALDGALGEMLAKVADDYATREIR